MKIQTQKTAATPPKVRRETQPRQQTVAPLLTVTLDAQASACVRRFAEEFEQDVSDVASGAILDTLPQALEEWKDTKKRREKGLSPSLTYWEGTQKKVCDARKRRLKRDRKPVGKRADYNPQITSDSDNASLLSVAVGK